MTAAGCLGGTPWDVRSLQPPVTRESLVQRVSQIRFSAMALVLPSATETFSLPGAIRQPSGLVTHTASSEFAIFYMARHRSRWAQRVPTESGPCHACRDEGGHLVAHLGQGLGSRISARQANKATLGPVPCHVVMMHYWMPLQIWTRASWSGTIAEDGRTIARVELAVSARHSPEDMTVLRREFRYLAGQSIRTEESDEGICGMTREVTKCHKYKYAKHQGASRPQHYCLCE